MAQLAKSSASIHRRYHQNSNIIPSLLVGSAVTICLLASSSIPTLDGLGWVSRFVAFTLVCLALLRPNIREVARVDFSGAPLLAIVSLAIGYTAFLVFSALPHGYTADFLLRLFTAATAIVVPIVLIKSYRSFEIRRGLLIGLNLVVTGSLLWGLASPDIAFENDRLRGVLENANLLGFTAFLGIAIVISARHSILGFVLVVVPCSIALFASGSRAALLSLVLFVALSTLRRTGWARALVLALALSAAILFIFLPNFFSSNIIFRLNWSRDNAHEVAMWALDVNPIFGIGPLDENSGIAGTYYASLISSGLLGTVGLVMGLLLFLIASSKIGSSVLILSFTMLFYAYFESWLLSMVGPIAICFFVAWSFFTKQSLEEEYHEELETRRPDRDAVLATER